MVSRGAAWTTGPGLRWFVRVAAIFVGLANLPAVILWFVGGLYTLAGRGTSLGEVLPSVLVAVIVGVATSELILRVFELPGPSFWHRYGVAVASLCLGGTVMGTLLAAMYAIDGTLGADPPPGELFVDPLFVLFALPAGFVGAGFRLMAGLAEGLILGFPLAAALGALRDD